MKKVTLPLSVLDAIMDVYDNTERCDLFEFVVKYSTDPLAPLPELLIDDNPELRPTIYLIRDLIDATRD